MLIRVVPHDPRWEEAYKREAEKIREILGDILVDIHHIGSTAVKGLSAKPIIDIMPVVTDLRLVDRHNGDFAALGYECMGEFGIAGRRYFRKGGEIRTHQIHVFSLSSQAEIVRHLAVRDYLRSHPEEASSYGALKKELAVRFPNDIDGYCAGKDAFMRQLESKALRWLEKQ